MRISGKISFFNRDFSNKSAKKKRKERRELKGNRNNKRKKGYGNEESFRQLRILVEKLLMNNFDDVCHNFSSHCFVGGQWEVQNAWTVCRGEKAYIIDWEKWFNFGRRIQFAFLPVKYIIFHQRPETSTGYLKKVNNVLIVETFYNWYQKNSKKLSSLIWWLSMSGRGIDCWSFLVGRYL